MQTPAHSAHRQRSAAPSRPPTAQAGTGPAGSAGRRPRPPSTTANGRCDLPGMARAFAQLFCEVEAGRRPRRQLRHLLSPLLYARLSMVWVRAGAGAQLLGVHGTLINSCSYEVVALVRRGRRVGALAFKLGRTAVGWRVTEIARPEDGPLPDPPFPLPRDEPDIFDVVLGPDQTVLKTWR